MAIIRGEAKIGRVPGPAGSLKPGEESAHSVARVADRCRRRGQFDQAIALCLQVLKARSTYVSPRVVLGRAYLESGDQAKAEEEFHRVLELSPENVRARVHLAQICEAQGRTNDAIRHYEAALEFAPLDREMLASLLTLRRTISTFEPSLTRAEPKDVPELAGFGPVEPRRDPLATETLADLYASQGLMDHAAAIYEQLLEHEPFREDIRAKLTALREKREPAPTPRPEAPSPPVAEHPVAPCPPQAVAGSLPSFDVAKEPAAVAFATPLRRSRKEMVLEELESWLQGVRRYRMAEGMQPRGAVETHPSPLVSTTRRLQVFPPQSEKGSSARRILVLNGPNLNLLGRREPDQYGRMTLKEIEDELRSYAASREAEIRFVQTNHEGALIDAIQNAIGWADAIVVNPAGLTHTSVGLRDAIVAAAIPAVEVHLSNIYRREEFRRQSLIADVVAGQITGFGPFSYVLGLQAALHLLEAKRS
jgi:3-dehydroquinate dehydratase-2